MKKGRPGSGELVLAATTNRGKLREITAVLDGLPFGLLSLRDLGIDSAAPEEGRTFMENARQKGLFYSRLSPHLTLAEDSGLEVDHLGGAPGVYSARFSGPGADDARNLSKVLDLMREVPEPERGARFVCCVAICRNDSVLAEITGSVDGSIAAAAKGRGGFGYDPIFFYPPLGKTFAELAESEKNSVSHRGRALREVREFLTGYLAGRRR